jgi:hypothetical protein
MRIRLTMLLIGCAAFSSCVSPETTRTRGGGPGADVGNHGRDIKMHEGSDPFWKTPQRTGAKHPSLEPARQARELDRP